MDVGSAKPTMLKARGLHHGLRFGRMWTSVMMFLKYLNMQKEVILDAYSENPEYWLLGEVDSILRSFFASVVDGVSVSKKLKIRSIEFTRSMVWMAYLKN